MAALGWAYHLAGKDEDALAQYDSDPPFPPPT